MAHSEALVIDPEIVSRNNDGTVNIIAPTTGEIVTAEAIIAYRIVESGEHKPRRCIQ